LIAAFVCVSPLRPGRADGAVLPVAMEATLIGKVASYDRNFAKRAGEKVHVLLVTKSGNADSAATSKQLYEALSDLPHVGGLPHEETLYTFTTATALAQHCKSKRVAIAVFGPGFDSDIEAIRVALLGADILTVSTVPRYVEHGIVLGFDVVSGRPKLLVHLTQARLQQVALNPALVRLMKVYE
jgi:hypothetical protein